MQIQVLAFVFFFQPFFACQQSAVKTLEASVDIQANEDRQTTPLKENKTDPETVATKIIFQSSDGGQTWQDVSAGLPKEIPYSFFANENELIFGTKNGFYRGNSQTLNKSWRNDLLTDETITNICPGREGNYFCSYEKGFFQEIANTGILRPMHNALKNKRVRVVLETSDGSLIVCCDGSILRDDKGEFHLDKDGGIFKSTDNAASWKQVLPNVSASNMVEKDGALFCAAEEGVLRSTDAGEHWEPILKEDGNASNIEIIGQSLFAITRGIGAWKDIRDDPELMSNRLQTSDDNGKTWQRIDQSLAMIRNVNAMYQEKDEIWTIRDIKQADGYLFCSLDTGIYRSSDWGKTWELMLTSPEKFRSYNLAVSGKVIYAVLAGGC
jgi:photosystem II stability/assembly factor-like uncharacterized protein